MKILQVSKFFPPVMGGIESVAWELAEGLQREQIDGTVLCSNQSSQTLYEVASTGYDVWRAGSWGRLLSTSMAPAMVPLLRRLVANRDVVHVHMPDPMAAMAMLAASPRAAVVVHWHSDVIRQRLAMTAYEPLQNWLLRRADAIVATSPPYAETSEALKPWRSKVVIIPIGISEHRGKASGLQAETLRHRFGNRRIVFALGRTTYYKGFDVLIEAAASLPDDCAVLIGGEGELLEAYRSRVLRRGLGEKVYFLGHIPDEELPSLFQACDVFCMPSTVRAEAYGVAMLEAMAMGKPAVATNIAGSGVPWVNRHGETGLNVPPGDAAALAESLRRLLDDRSLRERMGVAARLRYEQHFTANLMTRRFIDLYSSLPRRREAMPHALSDKRNRAV